MTSPTQRTLQWLRDRGWQVAVVEKWIAQAGIRKDLWGADIIAIHQAEKRHLLVQTTSASNASNRTKKVQSLPEVATWLASGGEFQIFAWDGERLKIIEVMAESLEPVVIKQPRRRSRRPKQPELFAD